MTDYELLELAAKAAGFRRDFQWNCRFLPSAGGSVLCGNSWTKWNPLEDDGDALRLAEKLGLTICMNGTKSVSAFDEYNKNVLRLSTRHTLAVEYKQLVVPLFALRQRLGGKCRD